MRHSRYKYFSNVDYAKQFLAGNMFHQTAAYFRRKWWVSSTSSFR